MKKEYLGVTICALFLLSYVLDYLAGPFSVTITNPFIFLDQQMATYPFTTAAIAIKTLGLLLSMIFILSFVEKKYFVKAIVSFFIAALFEFYAIQQLATGQQLIPVQWTLSLAYAGVTLIILTITYIIIGIVTGIYRTFADDGVDPFAQSTNSETTTTKE